MELLSSHSVQPAVKHQFWERAFLCSVEYIWLQSHIWTAYICCWWTCGDNCVNTVYLTKFFSCASVAKFIQFRHTHFRWQIQSGGFISIVMTPVLSHYQRIPLRFVILTSFLQLSPPLLSLRTCPGFLYFVIVRNLCCKMENSVAKYFWHIVSYPSRTDVWEKTKQVCKLSKMCKIYMWLTNNKHMIQRMNERDLFASELLWVLFL
jgi:hypothetical protein